MLGASHEYARRTAQLVRLLIAEHNEALISWTVRTPQGTGEHVNAVSGSVAEASSASNGRFDPPSGAGECSSIVSRLGALRRRPVSRTRHGLRRAAPHGEIKNLLEMLPIFQAPRSSANDRRPAALPPCRGRRRPGLIKHIAGFQTRPARPSAVFAPPRVAAFVSPPSRPPVPWAAGSGHHKVCNKSTRRETTVTRAALHRAVAIPPRAGVNLGNRRRAPVYLQDSRTRRLPVPAATLYSRVGSPPSTPYTDALHPTSPRAPTARNSRTPEGVQIVTAV
jgi:hypothetical protein